MHHQPTAVPSRREARLVSPGVAGGPWLGEPGDTGAHLAHRQAETGPVAVAASPASASATTVGVPMAPYPTGRSAGSGGRSDWRSSLWHGRRAGAARCLAPQVPPSKEGPAVSVLLAL